MQVPKSQLSDQTLRSTLLTQCPEFGRWRAFSVRRPWGAAANAEAV
jgi:hypothetical protein